MSLFERHRSGVRATAAGRQFPARPLSASTNLTTPSNARAPPRAAPKLAWLRIESSILSCPGRRDIVGIDYRLAYRTYRSEFSESDSEGAPN